MKNSILSRLLAPLIVATIFMAVVTSHAVTYTLANTNDSNGVGTLRRSIADAVAAGPGPHVIEAGGVTGTISLGSALTTITNCNITINGPTSGTLTVTRGSGTFRIFTVTNSGGAASLTVNNLTMTNGVATVDIEATAVGGGIGVKDSTLVLNYCTVSGCSSGGNGGGIMLGGTVASTGTLNFCTISGNTAGGAGGGISTSSGISGAHVLNLTNSTISGNSATGASGGGLTFVFGTGNVKNCTISGNTAAGNGGGVNVGSSGATFNATNCTITANTAPTGVAGGIRSTGTGGSTVNLINTLVVGNTITGGAAEDTNWGTGTKSAKNSVVGVHAGTAYGTVTASQIGTSGSPKVVNLGALANNGGVTQTHALLASAPELAINLGSNVDANNVPSDQRGVGYDRFKGGTVDIGAFETGNTAPTFTGVTPLGAPATSHGAGVLTLNSFTVPPGTNRLLVVVASDTQSLDVTSVSFGGTPMTQSVEKNDGFAVDSIWVLPLGTATTATTGNITVARGAPGDRTFIAAQVFQNVHQTTPVSATDSFEASPGNTTPVTRSIASAAGDLVLDVFDVYHDTLLPTIAPAAANNQAVVHYASSAIGVGFDGYQTSIKPGGAPTTSMSWTHNGSDTLYAAINIKQAGGSCPTITVTNPGTTTGTAGTAFSQTFTQSGGAPTVTFTTASALPTGLTLSTAGVLSGTPTQTGTFNITVTATDANLCTGTGANYALVITCPTITVTNPAVTSGTAGTAFSQTFTQTGGGGAATFTTASALPAGLTLSTAGVLSGTPTQTGVFNITVTATGPASCTGTGSNYALVITCPTITVTNPAVTTGIAGTAFSQTFTQTGGGGAATFTTASALPTGLTLSTAGVLSGIPTQTGIFNITVIANGPATCSGTGGNYALVITCPTITVTNPAVTSGTAGTPFSQTFTQSGGGGAATFTTASALPTGLTLGTAGVLSGTPTQTGNFNIVVTVTGVAGCIGTGATYSLTIISPAEIVVTYNGNNVADGSISPATLNGTDFGNVPVAGVTVDHVFTITNTGGVALTLGAVSAGGDFTVTQPTSPVAINGGTTTFTVSFNPSAVGVRNATISFTNSDGDESPFTFDVTGTGTPPQTFDLAGNAASNTPFDGGETYIYTLITSEIAIEQPVTNVLTDGVSTVNFGTVEVAGTSALTFTIRNLDLTGTMNLGAITFDGTNPGDFSVTTPPSATVGPNSSTTMVVTFKPLNDGARARPRSTSSMMTAMKTPSTSRSPARASRWSAAPGRPARRSLICPARLMRPA